MATKPRLGNSKLAVVGVGLLAVIALCVSAFAFTFNPEPSAPTINVAKVQAAQDKFEADQAAKEAAIVAANAPLKLTQPTGRPLKVLFSGGSISVGRDASTETNSYRVRVIDALAKRGKVEAVRIGDSGKTTADVLPEANALKNPSDLLVVELGTNDVYKTEPGQFAEDYPRMLDAVRKPSPNAPLICVGVWQSSPTGASLDASIESECEKRGGRFVPLRTAHQNPSNKSTPGAIHWAGGLTDGAHPNDAGHEVIAASIMEKLNLS